jgi:hypothetical protein
MKFGTSTELAFINSKHPAANWLVLFPPLSCSNHDPMHHGIFSSYTSVEGFIMDQYCVFLGTLLDRPDLLSLQYPDEHSVHW